MFKVCIADDEKFVQRSIAQRIEESGLEFAIIGKAGDGIEALRLYEKEKPDVFFVDINMPIIGGLEFIETVRQRDKYTKTRFVIISGYDDFSYMQKAIRLGVINYIKKPILQAEFSDMLWDLYQELQDSFDMNQGTEEGVWWIDFCRTWKQQKKEKGGEQNGTFLIVYGEGMKDGGEIRNKVMQICGTEDFHYIRFLNADNVRLLFWPQDQLDQKELRKIYAVAEEYGAKYFVSYVGKYDDPESMEEAMENRLNLRFYRTDCCCMTVEAIKRKKENFDYGAFDAAIDGGKREAYMEALDEIITHIFSREENAESFKQVFQSLVIVMANKYTKYNLELPEELRQEFFPFHLTKYKDRDVLIRQLYSYAEALHEKIAEITSHSELVDNVISYIKNHYTEELSLPTIAGEFFVAPTYLSKKFKEKKNCTVMQFLEGVRLKEAAVLLRRTEYSVTEVAQMTGYNDPNYFARAFKKIYKMTPLEYRNIK